MCYDNPEGSNSSNTLYILDKQQHHRIQIHTSTQVTFWRVLEAMAAGGAEESFDDSPETVARTSDSGTFDSSVMQASTKLLRSRNK